MRRLRQQRASLTITAPTTRGSAHRMAAALPLQLLPLFVIRYMVLVTFTGIRLGMPSSQWFLCTLAPYYTH